RTPARDFSRQSRPKQCLTALPATRSYPALLTSSNFSRNLVCCFLTLLPHVILPALTQEGSAASRRLILSRRSALSISGSGRAVEESLFGVAKTAGCQQSHTWLCM